MGGACPGLRALHVADSLITSGGGGAEGLGQPPQAGVLGSLTYMRLLGSTVLEPLELVACSRLQRLELVDIAVGEG